MAASSKVETKASLIPRAYQQEIFQHAIRQNVIAVMDTGSGKTQISVMLIRWITSQPDQSGKKIFFLVPTVALVQQQSDFVTGQTTGLRVGGYTGGMDVDLWDREKWLKELQEHDVLIMTPAILVRLLMHGYVTMPQISLIIFDEAHHARGKHPYADIMRSHYSHPSVKPRQKPKIFGMTASPTWGTKSPKAEIAALELLMNCRLQSVMNNRDELRKHSPHAKIKAILYPAPEVSEDWGSLWNSVRDLEEFQDFLQVTEPVDSASKSKFQILAQRYESTRMALGAYAADYYIFTCLERTKVSISSSSLPLAATSRSSLRGCLPIIQRALEAHKHRFDPIWPIPEQDVSKKVWRLVALLNSHSTDYLQAIIFVQMRNEVHTLAWLLPRLPGLKGTRAIALVGHGGSDMHAKGQTVKEQQKTVRAFRDGEHNLLIATDVAEEGLDFQALSLVIKFDAVLTLVSLAQSLGRARKADSNYYAMLPDNCPQEIARFRHLVLNSLAGNEYSSRGRGEVVPAMDVDDPDDALLEETRNRYVTPKGAILTYSAAVPLLSELCASIPHDIYTPPLQPIYSGTFEATVILPSALPIPRDALVYEGPPCGSKGAAKRAVAFKAVRALHILGVLDDYLIPERGTRGGNKEDVDGRKPVDLDVPKVMTVISLTPFEDPWSCGQELWIHPVVIDGTAACGLVTARGLVNGVDLVHRDVGVVKLGDAQRLTFANEEERVTRLQLMDAYSLMGFFWGVTTAKLDENTSTVFLVLLQSGTNLPDYEGMQLFVEKPTSFWERGTHLRPGPILARNRRRHRALVFNRVRDDLTPLSPPERVEGKFPEQDYSSYLEYWDMKNQKGPPLEVKPDDMMLEFRQLPRARTIVKVRSKGEQAGGGPGDRQIWIYPHSTCVSLHLPIDVYHAFTALPSLLRHIMGYHKVSCIQHDLQLPPIDSARLLEALTCPLVTAGFDYQRLETLGDSCLKVATSVHIFKQFPNKHEGQLTSLREGSVSNLCLRSRAFELNLFKYIDSDRRVQGRTWNPPSRTGTHHDEHGRPLVEQRIPRKALQDCVEATLGAAWLTGGIELVLKVGTSLNLAFGGPVPWPQRYQARAKTMDDPPPAFRSLYDELGYQFNNPWLLVEALTHPSFQSERTASYQRLEFLGDAIVDLFFMQFIYREFPQAPPGKLSHARASAVCNFTLSAVAVKKLSLDRVFFYVSPLLGEAMEVARAGFESMSWTDVITSTWKFDVPKALGDLTEAMIGAIFIDSNYDLAATFNVLYKIMGDVLKVLSPEIPLHPTAQLMMYIAKGGCMAAKFRRETITEDLIRQQLVTLQIHGNDVVPPIPARTAVLSRSLTCEIVLNKFLTGDLQLSDLCTCGEEMAAEKKEENEVERILIVPTGLDKDDKASEEHPIEETEIGFGQEANQLILDHSESAVMVECDHLDDEPISDTLQVTDGVVMESEKREVVVGSVDIEVD
ncbi:Dicer-like protein 1 [Tulasnella sp. JGI-2019a]|nr:Dicer-like protein 1 [Tulasnella sp. JGI-2019a]KAG9011224.1 Dicer-like protein 1 [Tulasnella sp. JGI-2019a]